MSEVQVMTQFMRDIHADHHYGMSNGTEGRDKSARRFDRWLDRVRREAKVEALREATTELNNLDPKGDAVFWDGEYYVFVHGWLHERADQLEQEGKNGE